MSVPRKRMTATAEVETAEAERGKPACSKYATNGCVRRSGPSPVRNAATHELTSRIDKASDLIEDCDVVQRLRQWCGWLSQSAPGARCAGSGPTATVWRAETPLPLPLPALGAGGWWPRRAVGWVGSGEGSGGASL